MNPLYAILGAIVLLIGDFAAGYYFRGQHDTAKVEKTELKEVAADQAKDKHDEPIIANEGKSLEAAKAADPDPAKLPDVRVCYYKPIASVQNTAPAGIKPDATPAVRPGPPQSADITPAIVHVGAVANAQVVALQDYINRVCLAK